MTNNWPNTLTWIRIISIPLIVVVFYLPVPWARPAVGLLFALAGITDYLDGYLARRLGQTSSFGAFLDPVADKLIVATALVLLVQKDPQPYLAIVAAIIIGREIAVSALREWMSQVGERAHVAVSFFAKCKTTVQIIGIALMLYEQPLFGLPIYTIGMVLLFVAAGITVWSMLDYLRAAWPVMMKSR
ncbi:CDP-diacylglycerol--glycerol-3-phosphate 3-phosphatidyltransferase [Candidatus Rariloculus sp.]|uniref:CDP-diacylglycerol--glycerol-3-phosphate 3-phosphatidyltransferase n=1 Tax=Candidatus Rariloculus sp. TaxID=3101265 RepID=UPI003D14D203